METESRARIRRLAAENEQLKLELARCSCGRGRFPSTREASNPYRLLDALDEVDRLRSTVQRLERERTQSPALLVETMGVGDVIRRYRRVVRTAQHRIRDLEALVEARSSERQDEAAADVLKQAVECLQSAQRLHERSLEFESTRQQQAAAEEHQREVTERRNETIDERPPSQRQARIDSATAVMLRSVRRLTRRSCLTPRRQRRKSAT